MLLAVKKKKECFQMFCYISFVDKAVVFFKVEKTKPGSLTYGRFSYTGLVVVRNVNSLVAK
jgi:hypothetical protein